MTFKMTNYILFTLFFCFAIVQLNDSDGIHWFFIYFLVAVLCLASNFFTISKVIYQITWIGLMLYAMFHFSLFIDYLKTDNKNEIFGEMVYDKPYLEGSREFLGLFLAGIAIYYQLRKRKC